MLKQLVQTQDNTILAQEVDLFVPTFDKLGKPTNTPTADQVTELPVFGGPWGDPDQYTWIDAPQARALSKAKDDKINEMKGAFVQATSVGFTCSNGIVMDAQIDAISKLKSGYDLAVLLNQTTMDIRDFNNVTRTGVLLTDALTMITELGVNYQTLWTKKNTLLDLIQAKKSLKTIQAIVWV